MLERNQTIILTFWYMMIFQFVGIINHKTSQEDPTLSIWWRVHLPASHLPHAFQASPPPVFVHCRFCGLYFALMDAKGSLIILLRIINKTCLSLSVLDMIHNSRRWVYNELYAKKWPPRTWKIDTCLYVVPTSTYLLASFGRATPAEL